MNRDAHIKEAERLLDGPEPGIEDYEELRRENLAAALVHATLALAYRPDRAGDWGPR